MELSVSFTGEESAAERDKLYISEESCLGSVFIPKEGVRITGPIRVRYEKYPWIEKFEVDGLKPAPPKRKGVGTKDIKGFVRSLSTIYSGAYDDYDKYFGEGAADSQDKAGCNAREKAREYFAAVTAHFIRTLHESMGTVLFDSPGAVKLFRKFCGFTENMWREGNGEMLGP